MPKFSADPTGPVASTFAFSAVDISTLGASEYTLVGLAVDCSGSVAAFRTEEEEAIKAIIAACRRSPRADNLMLRFTRFDTRLHEGHGFKLLQDCNPADYDGCLPPGGLTALYDGAVDIVDSVARYGRDLSQNDFSVNGIVFVITDGCNNTGTMTVGEVKKSLERVVPSEAMESIVSVLVGVNVTDHSVKATLEAFARDAGFTKYVDIGSANEKTLAKLADFVSKSISSQSQALGTGGPSQALPTF